MDLGAREPIFGFESFFSMILLAVGLFAFVTQNFAVFLLAMTCVGACFMLKKILASYPGSGYSRKEWQVLPTKLYVRPREIQKGNPFT